MREKRNGSLENRECFKWKLHLNSCEVENLDLKKQWRPWPSLNIYRSILSLVEVEEEEELLLFYRRRLRLEFAIASLLADG